MESLKPKQERYGEAWFRNRAFEGLRRIGERSWDYSDSLLLYLPGSDERYETVQETDTPYHRLVTTPERHYLEGIAPSIADALPEEFDYIDLGPGTEHKEQFLFDALRARGKRFRYRPVDISARYLALSREHAERQGIEVEPLQASFEETAEALGESSAPRLVSLGLTYINYDPGVILPLLKRTAGRGGTIFINAHIRERADMEALVAIYTGVADSMAEGKLRLIGINPAEDIESTEVTDDIRIWYTLKQVPDELRARGMMPGDRLLAFQSLRHSLADLERDVSAQASRYTLLDAGGPFVGALIGTER